MANTYTLIEAKTLTTSTASVTFSSIPATYTDLKVVISSRTDFSSGPAEANKISFNGNTTNADYTQKRLLGDGATASSQSQTNREVFFNTGATATADTFANSEIYIPNYAGANAKSASIDTVTESNTVTAYAALIAILWSGTAAITSIAFVPENATNYVQYSTFYLYGIKNS